MDTVKGNIVDINIATALAIQGMLELGDLDGNSLPKPAKKIDKNCHLLISMQTFVRNFIGSLENKDIKKLVGSYGSKVPNSIAIELASQIVEELDTLSRYLADNNMSYGIYNSPIPDVPLEKLRDGLTINKSLMSEIMSLLKDIANFHSFRKSIRAGSLLGDIFLVTSSPYDIIETAKVNRVYLVESHTGKVKGFDQFYTKYYPVPKYDMSNLPFNLLLLNFLGDRNTIKPSGIVFRRELLDILSKSSTVRTSEIRIKGMVRLKGSDMLRKFML